MMYSVPRPEGDFDYYDTPSEAYIGDDLPVVPIPKMPIGVPAYEQGRPLPPNARLVGRGSVPKGLVAKMRMVRQKAVSGLGAMPEGMGNAIAVGAVAAIVAFIWSGTLR